MTIPDHHPGYVSRERFLANRQRLAANKTNTEVISGPAREGHCLLQGMLVCGSCGRRLTVRYTGNGGLYPIYECNWHRRAGLTRTSVPEGHSSGTCLTTRAAPIDAAIGERLAHSGRWRLLMQEFGQRSGRHWTMAGLLRSMLGSTTWAQTWAE